MKKIYLLLAVVLMCSCCTIMPDPDVHFLDEKFVLIEKTEREMNINSNTKNVRTWKIQRVKASDNSLEIGVIDNKGFDCIINDELWYNREVGDTLYFEYICKDRFYKVENLSAISVGKYEAVDTPMSITPEDVKKATIINMNKMEIEMEILEKERQLISLEREIETLKESIK